MDPPQSTVQGRSFGYTSVAAVFIGLFVIGSGILLVPQSGLGGLWIAAIGLSVLLAGLFHTPWVGQRYGISDGDRRTLSRSFIVLAVVLAVSFVVIGSFGGVETEEITSAVVDTLTASE